MVVHMGLMPLRIIFFLRSYVLIVDTDDLTLDTMQVV